MGTFISGLLSSSGMLGYTTIQHNYPRNPLPQPCWISDFFDAVRGSGIHHAEDVVYDDGSGKKGVAPPYGTPVYAMESGTVIDEVSTAGPVPEGWPACDTKTGHHAGNYVKIKADSEGYTTLYFHVKPSVGYVHVNAGQQIGVLDNSGCQTGAHTHVQRKDANGSPVNFTIPRTNPLPTKEFYDGLVDDWVDSP